MRPLLSASTLCALVLAASAARAAETAPTVQVRSLQNAPTTLRGARPTWSATVQVDAPEERLGPPVLTLEVDASELLDHRRSTLTLEVDDVPRATRRLGALIDASAASRPWRVPLGELPEGFHRIAIVGRLVVQDDPCLRDHEREAWVGVQDAEVRWRSTATTSERTVRAQVARLAGAAARVRSLGSPDDPAAAAAFLEAHAWLWRAGVRPLAAGRERSLEGSEVQLAGDVVLAAGPRCVLGAGVEATLRTKGDDLSLCARDWGAAEDALRRLRSPALLARCDRSSCALGPALESDEVQGAAPEDDPPPGRVLTLAEAGFPRGWTARGEGVHVLRISWNRPAPWTLRRWPEIRLRARMPSEVLDPDRSRAVMRVNGVPLGSWRLGEVDAGALERRLAARVPEDVWADENWQIELEVTLRGRNDDTTCREDERGLWLSVLGDSELVVPRDEARYAGLGALPERLADRRPAVAWPADAMGWHELAALGTLLSPLATPGERWRVTTAPACPSPCVHVAREGRSERLLLAGPEAPDARAQRWVDPSGNLDLPVLDADGTLLLELVGDDVHVTLPGAAPDLEAPPRWEGFAGALALHHEGAEGARWEILAVPDPERVLEVRADAPDATTPRLTTEQEARVAWVNLATALLALLVVAVMAWRWRRRRTEASA